MAKDVKQWVALPTQFSATSLTPIFLAKIYCLHGMPKSIFSDRDKVFVSKFWRELFRLNGTKLAYSSAYHPESDGQTKFTNRILKTYLRCYVSDSSKQWVHFLHLAEYWYNSIFQSAIKMSPFEVLHGRPPLSMQSYVVRSTMVTSLDDSLEARRHMLAVIRENLALAQLCMHS